MTPDAITTAVETSSRRAGRRLLLAGAAMPGLLTASTAAVPEAGASVPPTPPGWTQVFADDFTGPANTGVNTADWLYDTGTSPAAASTTPAATPPTALN
jgi:hypothetical protein